MAGSFGLSKRPLRCVKSRSGHPPNPGHFPSAFVLRDCEAAGRRGRGEIGSHRMALVFRTRPSGQRPGDNRDGADEIRSRQSGCYEFRFHHDQIRAQFLEDRESGQHEQNRSQRTHADALQPTDSCQPVPPRGHAHLSSPVDGSGDGQHFQQRWGIVHADSAKTPKHAFTAWKELVGICGEGTWDMKTKTFMRPIFTPATLDYEVTGNTNAVKHLLLQKSDGRFYLLVWVPHLPGIFPKMPTRTFHVTSVSVSTSH